MSRLAIPGVNGRTLTINISSTVGARLLVPVLNVALAAGIARSAGVDALGQYTLLVTLFLLGEHVKSLGLTNLLVREVAQDRGSAGVQHRSLVRIGYWGALLAAPVIVAFVWATNPSSPGLFLATACMCLGLWPSAQVMANEALFLACDRASFILWISLLESSLRCAASLCVLLVWHGGVPELAAVYAGSRFIAAAAGTVARKRLGVPAAAHVPARTRAMLARAPEFLAIFILPILLFRMDVLFLGLLSSDHEVGVYGASARLISAALILPDGIMAASFAPLSRLAVGPPGEFHAFVRRMMFALAALLSVAALAAYLLAPFLLHTLYGAGFEDSTAVMQILVWAWVPFAVSRVLGDSLVALGKQAVVAKIILASTVLGSGYYVILIRSLGAQGAAWAFLASIGTVFVLSALAAASRSRVATASSIACAMVPAALGFIGFRLGIPTSAVLAFLAAQLLVIGFFIRSERGSKGAGVVARIGQENGT
jgi:O-antigen/teichoic acid export membrane protein